MSYEPEGWQRMDFSSKVGWSLLIALISLVGGLLLAVLLLSARADGRADFCYVQSSPPAGLVWMVEAHRPWRPDMTLGYFASREEAKRAGEAFGCRFHTEPTR